MVKSIAIGNKTYDMKASVHALLRFRELFNESAVTKVATIEVKKVELRQTKDVVKTMEILEEQLDLAMKLAYVMICEQQDKEFSSYEDWTKEVDSSVGNWMNEVIALAMSTFQG